MTQLLWWSDIKETKVLKDINWLDEVPMGIEGLAPMSPEEIDQLPDQARIWATLRIAVTQAYAEGYNDRMTEGKAGGLPF